MGEKNSDRWLSEDLHQGFSRTSKPRRSFWVRSIWRAFWTLASLGTVYFLYLEIGEQAKSMITSSVLSAQKNTLKAAPLSAEKSTEIIRSQFELDDRKEAAWQRTFKPSERCWNDANTVECANAHIRARRAFEATYRD